MWRQYKYKGRSYEFKKWRDTAKSWDKMFGGRKRRRNKSGCLTAVLPFIALASVIKLMMMILI
jgi:hypothetical protein